MKTMQKIIEIGFLWIIPSIACAFFGIFLSVVFSEQINYKIIYALIITIGCVVSYNIFRWGYILFFRKKVHEWLKQSKKF